ncbi:MAG: MFS transporter [Firmicutes bacterium]|nr:MFS transporter [Bacillota bacterium]
MPDLRNLKEHYGLHSRSVVLFLLASFLTHSTLGALNVVLNLYLISLGYTEEFVGLILSIKLFTSGLACIPAGVVCSRWGVRKGLQISSLSLGSGVLLLTITDMPVVLALGAVLIGIAQAAKATSAPPFLVENSTPRIRQNLFSLNFALMMFANMAGNALAGLLPGFWVDALSGYTGTLHVYGAVSLLSLLPLLGVAAARPVAVTKRASLWHGITMLRTQKVLMRLLLCHALIGFGAGLIVPLFNIFLSNKLGAGSGQIGIIMSLAQVGTAIGALVVPFIVIRLGRIATVSVLRAASIPFLILIATFTNVYGVATVFFLRSSLMNMTNPVESNFAMEMVGSEQRPVWSSMLKTMDTLTRGISVLIGGWLMARFSYNLPYYFTCGLYLVTSIFYWIWFRDAERQQTGRSFGEAG